MSTCQCLGQLHFRAGWAERGEKSFQRGSALADANAAPGANCLVESMAVMMIDNNTAYIVDIADISRR